MRSVDEALQEILKDFSVKPAETIQLHEGLGRTLAQSVRAANDLPHFDNSAMDGYAVRSADVQSLPMRLRVIGDIPAGSNPDFIVGVRQAARIMTGALLPRGADLVVPVEATDHERNTRDLPEWIEIREAKPAGSYIRRAGEDVRTGERLLNTGHVLRPQDLGLLAGLGIAQVPVVQKPRVAILSTGDELLPPDAPLQPGKIRDMNSYTIPAMVAVLGSQPIYLGVARDTEESVREKLEIAFAQNADLIISSAGVSVGSYDVVKAVVESMGSIGFWQVNMRPGKPLAYGHVGDVPMMGLPGNPVSSLLSFEIFARPAILKMLGQSTVVPEIEVTVGEDMKSDGRRSFIRVQLHRENGQLIATSTGTQSSGAISSLVKADGLLIIPEGIEQVRSGDKLKVRPFAGQGVHFL